MFAAVAVAPLLAQEPEPISAEDLAMVMATLMEENARFASQPLKLELDPSKATGFKIKDVRAIFVPRKEDRLDLAIIVGEKKWHD